MKKLVLALFLACGSYLLSAQSQTAYCPEANFSLVQPNISLHLSGGNGYSLLNGKYFLNGNSPIHMRSTIGTVYATDVSNYCSQTHWVKQGKVLVLPTPLQNKVWKGEATSGILIDNQYQAWIPQFAIDGIPTGLNKKSPQDADEDFVAILKDRLLSNKNRLYGSQTTGFTTILLPSDVKPHDLTEFTHNAFWHNDSTLVRYQDTAKNDTLHLIDTIALPSSSIQYVNAGLGYVASASCIYEYNLGKWDSLFVLDSSLQKDYFISEFTSTRILLKQYLGENYMELDYDGNSAWKSTKDGFRKLRTIPDTLFADFNGRYLSLIDGQVHENMGNWDEYYSNLGKAPSAVITSINNQLYCWARDTVFVKKDSISDWKDWISGPFGATRLEYDDQGNLLILNDSGYYKVSTDSKTYHFFHYPCSSKPSYAHFVKNGGFVVDCAQGAYIHDTSSASWKPLKGLKGIQAIVFAANRAIAIDEEALKYSVTDSFVFDSLKLSNSSEKLPVTVQELKEPTLLSIHGTIPQFILFGGSAQFNIQFSLDANNEMSIWRYIDFHWGYAPHSFLNYTVDGNVGYEPFEVKDAVFNGKSLTVLSDVGLVRYDCTSGMAEPEISEIELYPNPVSSQLHFGAAYEYVIYDLQGRNVQTGKGTYAKVSDLNEGMYLIKLLSVNQEFSGRFVKQ